MIICLACYKERLASLFGNATELWLFRKEGDDIRPVGRHSFPQTDPPQRVAALAAHGVNLLVCGGVCGREARLLEQASIRVAPWLCGEASQVIEATVQ